MDGRRWWVVGGAVVILVAVLYFGPDVAAWFHERSLKRLNTSQLETHVRKAPQDAAALYRLGQNYARQNRQLDATRAFLAALNAEPGRAEVLNDLGVSYLLQERYHEAVMALQAALEARPRFAIAKANLGRVRMAVRMPYSAIKDLEQAAQWDGKQAPTWSDLGQAHQEVQQYAEAERAFREAIRVNPAFQPARLRLGQTLYDSGKVEEADSVLREALRRQPNDPTTRAALGHFLVEQGKTSTDEAGRLLQQAVQELADDPEVQYDLGRVALASRDWVAAEGSFRTTLRLAPDHIGAMTQIQKALREQRKDREADQWGKRLRETSLRAREVKRLEERVNRSQASWDDRGRLAALYIETGKFPAAALIVREMEAKVPDHPSLPKLTLSLRKAREKAPVSAPK